MRSRLKQLLVVLGAVFPAVLCSAVAPPRASVSPEIGPSEQWDLYEITLTAAQVPAHPFRDVQVSAEFVHLDSGEKLLVPGFFDGDGAGGQTGQIWKIRFMPTRPGRWTWRTAATIPETGLNDHTGELIAAPPRAGNHGPLARSGPPYLHLSHADGHHPFLIGTWSIPMHFLPQERQRFYDYLQQTGMNRLRMWLGGRKSDGLEDPKARFFGGDYSRYNLAFFRQVDTTFRECQERGILVELILFVNDMEKDMTDADQQQYVRYLVARYSAFRALTICLCNQTDWHVAGYRSSVEQCEQSERWGNRMGGLLRQIDPFPTPLTTHDPGEDGQRGVRTWYLGALDRWPYAAWTDHIEKQIQTTALSAAPTMTGVEPRSDVLNERGLARLNQIVLSLRRQYRQPVEVDEPSFEYGDGIEKKLSWRALTKTGVRKVHWVITASGSFGTTCLVGCGEFMSGWDVDQLQRRGTLAQLGILARTLRSLPFWEMAPANELVSPLDAVIAPTRSPDAQRPSGPGAGDGQPWRSTFAIAKPGEAYLVYSLKGGDGTVQLAPGTYEVTQLNPRDGSTRALGEVTGGTVPFTLPGSAPKDHNLQDETDWVLIYRGHTK
jgi:hypothetical protein